MGKVRGYSGGVGTPRGTKVLYMSESRALAVLEVLVHFTNNLPDKYVIGSAEIPDDLALDVSQVELGDNWQTPLPKEQALTRRIGDEWTRSRRSPVLRVPSVSCVRNQSRTESGASEFLTNPVCRTPTVPALTLDFCGPLRRSAQKSGPSKTIEFGVGRRCRRMVYHDPSVNSRTHSSSGSPRIAC
jgi:hypothetical protein